MRDWTVGNQETDACWWDAAIRQDQYEAAQQSSTFTGRPESNPTLIRLNYYNNNSLRALKSCLGSPTVTYFRRQARPVISFREQKYAVKYEVETRGERKWKKGRKQMKNKHCYWKTGCFKTRGPGINIQISIQIIYLNFWSAILFKALNPEISRCYAKKSLCFFFFFLWGTSLH